MGAPTRPPVEVFRVNPVAFWVALFAALLLQAFLPLKISFARFFDFPLLVTIYFALVRRSQVFGIVLGTGLGLLQDAFSHGFVGIFGMAKALVGFLAASASYKFDLEQLVPRLVLAGILIFIHDLFLQGLQRALLESVMPFRLVDVGVSVMVNVALGLILFQALDRFKKPV